MKKTNKKFQVPWVATEDGRSSYVPFSGVKIGESEFNGRQIEWKSNEMFGACMLIHKVDANNYLPMIVLQDTETKCFYRMEQEEFMRMLKTTAVVFGTIVGLWSFEKSGRYFYLKFEEPTDD